MEEQNFINKVLEAFKSINKEIEKKSVEHNIRLKFFKYFIENVLEFDTKNCNFEYNRADITLFDESRFPIVIIETKRPDINIDTEEVEEHAFSYKKDATKFIGLTNFSKFKLWEIKDNKKELKVNIDLGAILKHKRFNIEDLDVKEKTQILFLNNITKEAISNPEKYREFDETYGKIDISKKEGFNKLLERLNYIVYYLLRDHVLKSFGEYKEGYNEYLEKTKQIDELIENNIRNKEFQKNLLIKKQNLEKEFERFKSFSGFISWKKSSGKGDLSDDEVRETFCKETIYVLLNKLIFVRICEDKGLIEPSISNGGIEEFREFIKKRVEKDEVNKEIVGLGFKTASTVYSHFYEPGILDWYIKGNDELDEKLNKTLWTLNRFNFSHVDRDILGNLYEKYLPREERKKLGEFYTPVEVMRYILNNVGYTYNNEIRNKDILDFSCGSGGFLVEATRRLISKFILIFKKADKKELKDKTKWGEIIGRLGAEDAKTILEAIQEHVYGFDINPFACHITEMNLLFQIIDLYQKIREKDNKYKLKRFKIYRTDSLEPANEQKNFYEFQNNYSRSLALDKEEIEAIKRKKFDFVVGNPPYVRKEKISSFDKQVLSEFYPSIYHGDNDYCIYFLFRGIKWLNENGRFGYIVSSKFTKTRYGQYIRAFIAENMHIAEFIDLRGSQVFANVTVDPAILILDKKKDNNIRVVNVKKDFSEKYWEWNLRNLIYHIQGHKRDYQDEYINSFTVDQNSILKQIRSENDKRVCDEWKLINVEELKIFDKIKKESDAELNEISESNCGIKTGKDDVFIVDNDKIKTYKLEKALLKPILDGKDIRKYKISYKNQYLIFTENINLSDFPNTKDYLSKYKDELEKRTDIIRTDKKWYELRPCDYYNLLEKEKIITPDISMKNNFSYDDGAYYIKNTAYFISINKKDIDPKYMLGLLNSTTLEFYFKKISVVLGRSGYRYTKQHLDRLVIKLPKTQEQKQLANQITREVNEILEINKTHQELKTINFEDLLKNKETKKLSNFASFSIRDKSKFYSLRIKEDRIYLNLIDYIEIKDKTIFSYVFSYLRLIKEQLKKLENLKELIYNIKVPIDKKDINDILKKLGPTEKEKESMRRVKQLEKEINELVYKLYDINQKEQKVIEDSIK